MRQITVVFSSKPLSQRRNPCVQQVKEVCISYLNEINNRTVKSYRPALRPIAILFLHFICAHSLQPVNCSYGQEGLGAVALVPEKQPNERFVQFLTSLPNLLDSIEEQKKQILASPNMIERLD